MIEIRIEAGYRNLSDVTDIYTNIVALGAGIPSSLRLVLAIDWRRCEVMAEEAAQQLSASMRGTNVRIERSGALLPIQSPVAMLQLARMLRESKNPARRGFTEPQPMIAWLSETLSPAEAERLRVFIG